MVLIVKKQIGARVELIFIPEEPLYNFLEKHVHRKGIYDRTTCLVTSPKDWTAKPAEDEAVASVLKSLQEQKVKHGERYYLGLCAAGHKIKAGVYDPVTKSWEKPGRFNYSITVEEIKGKASATIIRLSKYEKLHFREREKIKRTFHKAGDNVFPFIITHLHPVPG